MLGVPTFGRESDTVPPRETAPPPERPVLAVTVIDELARAALAILPAGRETDPAVTVRPDAIATLPVKLAEELIVWEFMRPEEIVPEVVMLPEPSPREVPVRAPAVTAPAASTLNTDEEFT